MTQEHAADHAKHKQIFLHDPSDNEDKLDIVEYWRSITKRKYPILAFGLAVALLAAVVVFVMTPIYRSTVTVPTASTDIALWADLTTTPTGADQLAGVLQVRITRSIGGGAAAVLYDGSVAGLAGKNSFAASLGSAWRSANGSSATGATATSAVYTVTLTLPADATTGAGSAVDVVLVLEARNVTA